MKKLLLALSLFFFISPLIVESHAVTSAEIEEPVRPSPIMKDQKEYGFKITQSKEYIFEALVINFNVCYSHPHTQLPFLSFL
jgi:hypothetical protein